jgi:hypothetical protein
MVYTKKYLNDFEILYYLKHNEIVYLESKGEPTYKNCVYNVSTNPRCDGPYADDLDIYYYNYDLKIDGFKTTRCGKWRIYKIIIE